MSFGRRHATGLTLLTTLALAILLSLLPLPDPLRPFQRLKDGSAEDLTAILFLSTGKQPLPESPAVPTEEEATAALDPAEPEVEAPSQPGAPPRELALKLLGAADLPGARKLETLARKVGARHVPIEQGCRRKSQEGYCANPSLAPFFRELDALLAGTRTKPVRVVHFGDSLIASDHISDVIRSRLQARYGSGGAGFLFVDRPTRGSGRTVRTGKASEGWGIAKITDRGGPASPVGYTGVTFTTTKEPQQVEFDVAGARTAELFFLTDPAGGDLQLRADGQPVGRILTRFPKQEPAFARTRLPPGAQLLSLTARGAVNLYGVSLEAGGPGVVYDSVGLPGATAKLLLRTDPTVFRDQLGHRDPSLVVLMLGGNEAFEFSRKETTTAQARESFTQLVARVREAVPDAACLLTSPMAAGVRKMSGEVAPRAGSEEIAQVVREVALEAGCAYWDMLAAAGGQGAMRRWTDANLMLEDLVHPRAQGSDLLGHLFDLALAEAHFGWRGGAALQDPPGLESPEALARTFQRLHTLEQTGTGRVGLIQLGASHTASHMFTDRVRTRMAERFGLAGRGFIGAGQHSKRLTSSGVDRKLTGEWSVLDALKPSGKIWGLTGIRALAAPGASAEFSFCEKCEGKTRSRLQLHFLEEPGMGRFDVLLDGAKMASFPDTEHAVKAASARVVELEAEGERHVLSVVSRGPGAVSVFGASHELDRAGVVLDAVGLPGSTIFTLASYDQPTLAQQLKARRPELYLLFYGTNESAMAELDLHQMRAGYHQVFQTLKEASPDAECLLIGPTDRMQSTNRHNVWVEAPSQRRVIPALREVARTHGCAFWSARAAMGGPGAIARWLERRTPLAHPDHVHLTPEGYAVLAEAFSEDLLAAYAASLPEGAR